MRGRRTRMAPWTWWRWLKNGRPRWCTGEPCVTDGVLDCGCLWDVGRLHVLCDMHEVMVSEAGLVLRDGELHRMEGS